MAEVGRKWSNTLPALIAIVGIGLIVVSGLRLLDDPEPDDVVDDTALIDPDGEFEPTDEAPPEYDYVRIEPKLLDVHKSYYGELRAEAQVPVRAPTGMLLPVVEIHVFEGDFVKAGDPLITLDRETLERNLEEAEEDGSRTEVDRFRAWLDAGATVIRAPNDGQIVEVYPELGHTPIDVGLPLVTMTDPENWTAVIAVPTDAPRKYVPIGTEVVVLAGDDEFEVRGTVTGIESPGAVEMTMAPPSESSVLVIGLEPHEGLENRMSVKIELPDGEREVALVPQAAVNSDGTRHYVRVWEGEDRGLVQRDLKLGGRSGEYHLVEYGVFVGEHVAVPKSP